MPSRHSLLSPRICPVIFQPSLRRSRLVLLRLSVRARIPLVFHPAPKLLCRLLFFGFQFSKPLLCLLSLLIIHLLTLWNWNWLQFPRIWLSLTFSLCRLQLSHRFLKMTFGFGLLFLLVFIIGSGFLFWESRLGELYQLGTATAPMTAVLIGWRRYWYADSFMIIVHLNQNN